MSLEDLRNDLKQNIAEASKLATVDQIRDHLVNTLWPYVEAQLEVVEEIDDAVAELSEQTEDYLNPETAGIIGALVQSGLHLSAELRKHSAGDELLIKRLDGHDQLSQQVMEMLGQITMIPDGEEPDDEGDDE